MALASNLTMHFALPAIADVDPLVRQGIYYPQRWVAVGRDDLMAIFRGVILVVCMLRYATTTLTDHGWWGRAADLEHC